MSGFNGTDVCISGCKGDGETAQVAGEAGDRYSDMSGDEEHPRAQPIAVEKCKIGHGKSSR